MVLVYSMLYTNICLVGLRKKERKKHKNLTTDSLKVKTNHEGVNYSIAQMLTFILWLSTNQKLLRQNSTFVVFIPWRKHLSRYSLTKRLCRFHRWSISTSEVRTLLCWESKLQPSTQQPITLLNELPQLTLIIRKKLMSIASIWKIVYFWTLISILVNKFQPLLSVNHSVQ